MKNNQFTWKKRGKKYVGEREEVEVTKEDGGKYS